MYDEIPYMNEPKCVVTLEQSYYTQAGYSTCGATVSSAIQHGAQRCHVTSRLSLKPSTNRGQCYSAQ